MMNPNDHDHDHDHAHTNHDHGHDHDHDHGHNGSSEAREKQIVMSFIEALLEGRLSVTSRRAVFGILSVDPLVRDAAL